MPSKIASETPFRLSTAFWTVVITFGIGWFVGLSQADASAMCPDQPAPPAPASAVMQLPEGRF